jgi:hypothetical protein
VFHRPRPYEPHDQHPVCLADQFVALVSAEGAQFSARVDALRDDHPTVRFVALMSLYADDVLLGLSPAPYSDAAAAASARRTALPARDFRAALAAGLSFDAIAERFCVPVDQTRLRADDPDCRPPARTVVRHTFPTAPMQRLITITANCRELPHADNGGPSHGSAPARAARAGASGGRGPQKEDEL